MKRFQEWLGIKQKIDGSARQPLGAEGEVWWVSIGENVGQEIGGKSAEFSRPALILRRLSHNLYLVVPLTSQPHRGNWFVSFGYANRVSVACLQQIRVIDHRRLINRHGNISFEDYSRIKRGFLNLYS